MCSPIEATAATALQNPPNPRKGLPVVITEEKKTSSKIRLVRWVSSYKQVFIAELLVRSAGQER
ncbi:MAG TPA: hypothetical protein VK699_03310 [Terriglobales bacterium]|jgi:hypothetical protein|nr:hypothetical protein [Terriglobales bacterium]